MNTMQYPCASGVNWGSANRNKYAPSPRVIRAVDWLRARHEATPKRTSSPRQIAALLYGCLGMVNNNSLGKRVNKPCLVVRNKNAMPPPSSVLPGGQPRTASSAPGMKRSRPMPYPSAKKVRIFSGSRSVNQAASVSAAIADTPNSWRDTRP